MIVFLHTFVLSLMIVGITDVDAEMREAMAKNEALSDALTSAEEANRSKTTFLTGMSHEIRTPINAIIGLDTLALKNEGLDEDTRRYLDKIGESAQHLLSLINDILDMSRIESGRELLRKEQFSLAAMLEQITAQATSLCAEKGHEFECSLIGQTDDSYVGDDMKIRVVLMNIISNAVKFTEDHGHITMTVEKTAEYEDQAVLRFCIKDNGVGMDKEFIPGIFDAFSQGNAENRSKYGRSGLGMALTKRIVDMMNGTIGVESERGVGSEFTVTLPLRKSSRKEPEHNGELDPQAMYILVVDDNPIEAEQSL